MKRPLVAPFLDEIFQAGLLGDSSLTSCASSTVPVHPLARLPDEAVECLAVLAFDALLQLCIVNIVTLHQDHSRHWL